MGRIRRRWDGDEATNAYAAGAFSSLLGLIEPDVLGGMKVLDFGCGTGLLTQQLVAGGAGSVTAVDTSPAMLAVLDAKVVDRGWANVVASLELPIDHGSFDLVVCSSVMAFVDDYPATVIELSRLLTPGRRQLPVTPAR